MEKSVHLSVRVKPEVLKKLDEIAKKTRYFKGDIIEKMVENTEVDEDHKEFYTNCSSGNNFDNLKQ